MRTTQPAYNMHIIRQQVKCNLSFKTKNTKQLALKVLLGKRESTGHSNEIVGTRRMHL